MRVPDGLVAAASALAGAGGRHLLGITGPPGSGKSTLADALATALTAEFGARTAMVVGMDGFHIADAELVRQGLRDRKGAPDTFDVHGYLSMLRRLRAALEPVTYAPRFDRAVEDSVAAAIAVPDDVALVITEGNYLLLDEEPWPDVAAQLTEVWYLDVPEPVRIERLVARRMGYGADEAQARRWALGSDRRNADLVEGCRQRATRIVGY